MERPSDLLIFCKGCGCHVVESWPRTSRSRCACPTRPSDGATRRRRPSRCVDGRPAAWLHPCLVAIAAHTGHGVGRAVQDEDIPEQIEVLNGDEIAGLRLKRDESSVGRHHRPGARAVSEASPHAVRDDAGRACVQVCDEDVRHPVERDRRMRRSVHRRSAKDSIQRRPVW